MSSRPRIVITGYGAVAGPGGCPEKIWRAFRDGDTSATRYLPEGAFEGQPAPLGVAVPDECAQGFGGRLHRRADRASLLALYAADQAVEHAGLDASTAGGSSCGVAHGTGVGGISTLLDDTVETISRPHSRASPYLIPKFMENAVPFLVGHRFELGGPARTEVTACSSALSALGVAFDLLRAGRAQRMVVTAADSPLHRNSYRAWRGVRVLARDTGDPSRVYRPFDEDRTGFVLAEGATAMVLEPLELARERGATIRAEILGCGGSLSSAGITRTSPGPQKRAMEEALRDGGLEPGDVGFVLAHASGTKMNDSVEAESLASVFGEGPDGPPISTSKPCTGHTLGVCGGLEMLNGMLSWQQRLLPPVPNLEKLDPDCAGVNVNRAPRELDNPVYLVNSFGFGGTNCCALVRAGEPQD